MTENLLKHCSQRQSIMIETRGILFHCLKQNGMMHCSKEAEKI